MMKEHSLLRLLVTGLLLMALAFITGSLASRSTGATADPVSIGSVSRPVGMTATVKLQAHNISIPKLGAWQINIAYAPAVLDMPTCTPTAGEASCNETFAADTIRLVGTASSGINGATIDLATLGFHCRAAGLSALTLTIDVFSDTNGQAIAHSIQNGAINCSSSVGGIARLADVHPGALQRANSSSPIGVPIGAAGVAGTVLVLAASAWLLSRRRSAK